MGYDEALAARVRTATRGTEGVTEMRMFGGLAFLVNGHLAVGASSNGGLMLRVDPTETESLVGAPGVTRFEMHGRSMNGWLAVAPAAVSSDEQLRHWVRIGLTHAGSLPPK